MKQNNNASLFADINDVPCQYPWLCYDETCDVLVIGGGVTGALCMYHLTDMGLDAVLVSQKPIGFSSACTNTSILQYQNETMLIDLSESVGKDEAIGYFKSCEQALNEIEDMSQKLENFYFKRRDSFIYTNSTSRINHLHAEYLIRRHNGFDVEFLEKADARNLFSFAIESGILAKQQAGEVDGYIMTHVLVSASEEKGARIYENTCVTEIENNNDGIIVTTAYGRKIHTKKVILATGKNQESYVSQNISIKTSFSLVTKPVEHFSGYTSQAIVNNIDNNIYLRTTHDNRIVIGGLDCSLLDKDGKIGKVIGVDRIVDRKFKELESTLNHMLVGIDTIEVEHEYTSEYGKTNDGMPYFGEVVEFPNIVFAMPSSINGILQSQIIAKKITKNIVEEF